MLCKWWSKVYWMFVSHVKQHWCRVLWRRKRWKHPDKQDQSRWKRWSWRSWNNNEKSSQNPVKSYCQCDSHDSKMVGKRRLVHSHLCRWTNETRRRKKSTFAPSKTIRWCILKKRMRMGAQVRRHVGSLQRTSVVLWINSWIHLHKTSVTELNLKSWDIVEPYGRDGGDFSFDESKTSRVKTSNVVVIIKVHCAFSHHNTASSLSHSLQSHLHLHLHLSPRQTRAIGHNSPVIVNGRSV